MAGDLMGTWRCFERVLHKPYRSNDAQEAAALNTSCRLRSTAWLEASMFNTEEMATATAGTATNCP